MSKYRCPKCPKGTTKKGLEEKGMCGSCFKVWSRWGFQQTLDSIPQEMEEIVRNQILDTSTLNLAASAMKKVFPLKAPARDWDAALVVLLDERRRNR